MRVTLCASIREALATAMMYARATGVEHQVGDTSRTGTYAVIEHTGHSYPGHTAPCGWFWVASVSPDGGCEHHSGFLARWGAEIARAKRATGFVA